jgi:RimJ/RimL family protein N-acetyltransferase
VGTPVEALLRPVVTAPADINPDDVRHLTDWRNRFVTSFLTEFRATEQRTSRWLAETVGPDDCKILFMLDDVRGHPVGYMGLAFINWAERYGEADSVVRGAPARPGLMKLALQTLLEWAHDYLELSSFGVRVRSDNAALDFYRKTGFIESLRVPLRREEDGELTRFIEDAEHKSSAISLVHMTYRPTKLKDSSEN